MRKRLRTLLERGSVLLLVLFVSAAQVNAQTTVQIGSGTLSPTNTLYSPAYRFSATSSTDVSRSNILFTADELSAAGITPGSQISKISFNKTSVAAFSGTGAKLKFLIANSSATPPLSTTTTWASILSTHTLVYDNQAQQFAAATGWVDFIFTAPFTYGGGSLEIASEWDFTAATVGSGDAFKWQYTSGYADYIIGNTGLSTLPSTLSATTAAYKHRPNIKITYTAAASCSGTPAGGTTEASLASVCDTDIPVSFSVSGSTVAPGLTYQWQSSTDNSTWTNIGGATDINYTASSLSVSTYFRRQITCSGQSSYSTPVQVILTVPAYAAIPYTESFETSWIDMCGTKDVPNNYWRNTPVTGNNSWRRNDEGSTAWTSNSGAYTPAASDGGFSARFHSYSATRNSTGQLDLHLNCNSSLIAKKLTFDFINTSGTDKLIVYLSADGGATFTKLDSVATSSVWKSKSVYFHTLSATTIVRFEGVSDFGTTDIGLDNIYVAEFPNCTGAPTGGTAVASVASICNPILPVALSVDGATDANALTYQWQSSKDNTTWIAITGATTKDFTVSGMSGNTYFRREITCSGQSSYSASVLVTLNPSSAYASLPYAESFENAWVNGCGTNDIPNDFWRNYPHTGNNSWRKNDDGSSASWSSATSGSYTPAASEGTFSARFHSYSASDGSTGFFDLYVNCNTAAENKRLRFDYINKSGDDSLVVYVSTDNGTTFIRLDSLKTSNDWRTKSIIFASQSATTIVRFAGFSDNGSTDIGLDNLTVADFLDCTGTPAGGTANASATSICNPALPVDLTVTGVPAADGLTFQWQSSSDNATWTDISGATTSAYTVTGLGATTYFRRQVTCTNSGATNLSSSVQVTLTTTVAYATLPYTESFENGWINGCGTNDLPNNFWKNNPATGNNSWRRNDEGATASWTSAGNGMYTPAASAGTYSARFHSYYASSSSKGQLDLYVNCATGVANKKLTFDYINKSGSDSLVVFVSTDNGATFTKVHVVKSASDWTSNRIEFTSSSATTIVRFEAVSDYGATDIGLDNINVAEFPPCSGAPAGGSATTTISSVCNATTPFTLGATGVTDASGITYQWQSSGDNTTWANINGATVSTLTTSGISASTYYRLKSTCSGQSAYSAAVLVTFATPDYATLPFTESFETGWQSICDTKDVPNNFWRNAPVTGNTSWRKFDEGATAWTNTSGAYSPAGSEGTSSARFHAYSASDGSIGQLDLYVNANTGIATKKLSFDYINTSGDDSLVVYVSTNGGTNFIRLGSVLTSGAWMTKSLVFSSASATTIVRFAAVSDNGLTDIGLDNIVLVNFPDCSGAPAGGSGVSTRTDVCNATTPFTLSVSGATEANALTFQWQSSSDNTTWTDISGATGETYDVAGITASTYYRRQVSCSGQGAYSAAVLVTFATPDYATLPFTESFETGWQSICDTKDVPNNFWRNAPVTGNTSWRKFDEGATAWTNTSGAYSPAGSEGTSSARFHAYSATNNSIGVLDLHINANSTSPYKQLKFDFINTSGTDSLYIYMSTNGGASFIVLDSFNKASVWTTSTILFNSNSDKTIIRFAAISDNGTTDIGLDNLTVIDFPDCTGTPAGGTTVTSSANVCREEFTLSLTGATTGAGISYQWQSSVDNVTWTDIANATELMLTTSQVGTHYYRVVVRCAFSNATATSTPVQVISPALVSGNFTIDNSQPTGGINFNTFNEAYDYIKCGINGAVLFEVKTGIGEYNEQLIMTSVPGASGTNTVTFRGNGVASIGFASTTSNERAVIKLRGADYIIFDNLVINATAGNYGYGVQLISDADSNIIRNCIINVSTSTSDQNFAGIVINGSEAGPVSTGTVLCDYNTFENNTIIGGYYGITMAATFTGGANGFNRFVNNDVRDFYQYGIYMSGNYSTLIEGNQFSRPGRSSVGDFYGIYFTTQKNTANTITRNRIFNPFGGNPANSGSFYGINFNNSDATVSSENMVTNNLIYNVNGEGAAYGISNTGSDHAWYFHNTISIDNTASASTQATRGFTQTTAAAGLLFMNNIISIIRGGEGVKHGIYLGTNPLISSDNNNLYINAAGGTSAIGYFTANRLTLNDWRTATGHDASSVSANPAFVDPNTGNYTPGNAGLDNKGLYLGVDTDILMAARSNTTPDMGAYEFTPPACTLPPVTGATMLSETTVCQNSPVVLGLNIGIFGAGQTFQWQTAASATGAFTSIGAPMLTPDTTILASTTQYYRAAITCGATTVFTDAVLLNVNPALPTGTYTINKNAAGSYVPGVAGGNFVSFAEAKAAMDCGITGGPVVFDVVAGSGPYNEQVKLDSIKGVTAVNTITFMGNGNTLSFNATNNSERAVIKLNGADHIIFDSLTIDASGGTYGYGVQLINNADSNTFRRNTIISSTASNSSSFAGVVINASDEGTTTTGDTKSDANIFDGNTITGGYYGVTLVGSETVLVNQNTFTNNKIQEFYNYGIFLIGTSDTRIEDNLFTRPTRDNSASSVYGIYASSEVSNNLVVSKNRFTQFFGGAPTSTSNFYGVYHNSIDAASGSENLVTNNLFYDLMGEGAITALYNHGSNNVRYYHNTIAIDHTASSATSATAGYFQSTTTVSGIEFKNNIVTIRRGGNGTKHALYLGTSSGVVSDHNNLYVNAGGTNNFVGYNGSNRTTLADWQAASKKDLNSLSVDPLYTNPSTGDFSANFLPMDNKGTPVGITSDIVDVTRSATTPDIGAFEFTPAACVTPPVAGTATVTPATGMCLETPIRLSLTGNSPIGTLTFQWQTSPDGVNWTNLSGIQYTPDFDTIATTSTYYRAAVSCGATTTYSSVVQVALNTLLPGGTYTINSAAPATYVPGVAGGNFQSFQSAVDAMLCGITGPVVFNVATGAYTEQIRIPYIPGTSNTRTVTFQSESGNAADAKLAFGASSTANYTLMLDSASNFQFKNLTIEATDAANGRAVVLTGNASHDVFENNRIIAPATTSGTNAAAGIYANVFKGEQIAIRGNTVSNGATGIYFAGTSQAALAKSGHLIDGNTVTGAYANGIYVQYTDGMVITNNTVSLNTATAANAAGIYTSYADSAFRLKGNTVNITNSTASPVYGIYVHNSRSVLADSGIIAANTILAQSNNTGSIYGLTVSASKGLSVVNNVIALNSAGSVAYGLHSLNNTDDINYYNNTSNVEAGSADGYAGYFSHSAAGNIRVFNNVFTNKGGGKALYVNNPSHFAADYNMLYSSGASLVQVATGTVTTFADLQAWTNTWNWDHSSISIAPAFVSATDLRPDLNNTSVWAMHGRGTQIKGNTYDFNNNYRPDALTAGVPDLGAFEFYPAVLPTVLTALPATPAANATQTFMFGSDTVMKITWGASAPPSVEVRRYSGVVPSGLLAGTDSMFFYTDVDIPGGGNYNYSAKLYYIDSWQGSIAQQYMIGMGRTTASNAWVIGSNSKVDVMKKEISQEAMVYLDRFTGLVNAFAQPEMDDSSSNRGKDFWVGYQRTNGFTGSNGGGQDMVIYMGAGAQEAHVTITIEGTSGTPWVRTYTVPANSALQSELIPKLGADDARLVNEGLYAKKGIHITSDVPIVAYAHIYEGTNSGATMLMPTTVWGYEYYTLSSRQNYSPTSYSAFHIVAKNDNTWVEINPSKPTRNGWVPNGGPLPNGSYLVKLNKGDAYQVLGAILSGSEGYDLTGSYVKAIANDQNECYPISVFAGSTRTGIGCGGGDGSTGDLILQQILPYQAWGNKYVTAPTSNEYGPNAGSHMTNIFRVMVKDPATVVKRNGVVLTGLINSRYYQYESNTADYIESNKPVLVAQFMSSGDDCANTDGDGDPEMFYLSPLQQAIRSTQFYRNDQDNIDVNFITMVIPTEGLSSLRIDGVHYAAYPASERHVYAHPNLNGYSVVTKRWPEGNGSSTAYSEQPFTGIVYGLGSMESYGYNIGTLVKNLNNQSTVNNVLNTGNTPTEYTCEGAPFQIKALLPLVPDSIKWHLSVLPKLSPNADSLQRNPVPVDTVTVDGVDYYAFTLNQSFTLDSAGTFAIPIDFWSPEIESCDKRKEGKVMVRVLPAPRTNFTVNYPGGGVQGCEGETVTFTGDVITSNGIALNQWQWNFGGANTASGATVTRTYPDAGVFAVSLRGVTADGCFSDTTKQVVINARPVVRVVEDQIAICAGETATFTVKDPIQGATYNWYDASTGGTLVSTGVSFTATNATPPANYYVGVVVPGGCNSTTRTRVSVIAAPPLTAATVRVDSAGINLIRFSWDAVPGAGSYQVSTDNGVTFVTPSSGATGLTHTINGLMPVQDVSIIVKALGMRDCQTSTAMAEGMTRPDQIFIPNSFTPNGDGRNDALLVYGYGIDRMQFMVFNQWGQKVFESSTQSIGWDGTHKGKQQPSGVYIYVVKMTLRDGTVVERKGSINLVR